MSDVAVPPAVGAAHWRNWSGTEHASPVRIATPGDLGEVCAAVTEAAAAGLRVKAIGSGHSFTGVAATDGVMISLDRLSGVLSADPATGLVTALAGTPLETLNRELAQSGLAMRNLGDIDRQTLAGAIATGTHGTGARLGGLASQVRAFDIVLADGTLAHCSRTEQPRLFHAARVGLGAFGVITTVTMACDPAFALHAVERAMPMDDVLGRLDDLVEANDHFEFYWFPHTRRVLTKSNNRVPTGTPLRPLGKARAWVDDELLANTVFEWTNRLTARWPGTTRRVNALATRALTGREYVDTSHRVFVSRRKVIFREMEYALPREALVDVLTSLDAWIERSGEQVSFPAEVRFAAADDAWLSTAYDRATAYLAVHQYHRTPHERYFRAVESMARAVGGRPHWGKLHYQNATMLRQVYPRFAEALEVRREVDPGGTFANAYLDRVLGSTETQ